MPFGSVDINIPIYTMRINGEGVNGWRAKLKAARSPVSLLCRALLAGEFDDVVKTLADLVGRLGT